MNRITRLFRKAGYLYRSAFKRTSRSFLFARKITIDREADVVAKKSARVFGTVAALGDAAVSFGEHAIVNKDAMISASGGTIIVKDACQLGADVKLVAGAGNKIVIGDRTTFYGNVLISGNVSVGSEVLFASNINILSSTHCIEGRKSIRELDREYAAKYGGPYDLPVIVGDECWIGLNTVLLPGTVLGKGCVVAAGAIVSGEFPEYTIIGGVPAKIIKHR